MFPICVSSVFHHTLNWCFSAMEITILYSHSVDPRKLCVGVKYYTVHMYSMPYYTYGSAANFLVLGSSVLIYIKRTAL